jgi:hypothetical protein
MKQPASRSHLQADLRRMYNVLVDLKKGRPEHLSDSERRTLAVHVEARIENLTSELGDASGESEAGGCG